MLIVNSEKLPLYFWISKWLGYLGLHGAVKVDTAGTNSLLFLSFALCQWMHMPCRTGLQLEDLQKPRPLTQPATGQARTNFQKPSRKACSTSRLLAFTWTRYRYRRDARPAMWLSIHVTSMPQYGTGAPAFPDSETVPFVELRFNWSFAGAGRYCISNRCCGLGMLVWRAQRKNREQESKVPVALQHQFFFSAPNWLFWPACQKS